jgi:hypothetical protein
LSDARNGGSGEGGGEPIAACMIGVFERVHYFRSRNSTTAGEEERRSPIVTVPSLEPLDLIPPFTFVPRKQIFSRLFDILSLQLIFP